MAVDIRVVEADRWPEYVRAAVVPFGGEATEEDIRNSRVEFEPVPARTIAFPFAIFTQRFTSSSSSS